MHCEHYVLVEQGGFSALLKSPDKVLNAMKFVKSLEEPAYALAVKNCHLEGSMKQVVFALRRIHDIGMELRAGCWDPIFDSDNKGQRGS